MSNRMTTAMGNNFRSEDVTYRHARRQSEIENEIEREEEPVREVKAPVSLTPEQVTAFYLLKIKDLQDTKKELLSYREKEIARKANEEGVDDIEE